MMEDVRNEISRVVREVALMEKENKKK